MTKNSDAATAGTPTLDCRCLGYDGRADPGHDQATQEDGLCDLCRCRHGCCEDHGPPDRPDYFGDDFDAYTIWDRQARTALDECRAERWAVVERTMRT